MLTQIELMRRGITKSSLLGKKTLFIQTYYMDTERFI